MADVLTLAQARDALGWRPGQNLERDPELSALYIPAVSAAFEAEFTVPAEVPPLVVLVAGRVLKRAWNADHQGTSAAGGRQGQPQPAAKDLITDGDRATLWHLRTLGGFA